MKTRSLIFIATMSIIALMRIPVNAEVSDVDQLIDTLVQKGVITAEAAAAIRAESALKKQEEQEKQNEFQISAGKRLKIAGYSQIRFQLHTNNPDIDTDDIRSIDIRRARIDLKGTITERFEYRLQVDFAGASAKLLDATAAYTFNPALKITIGQFKIPFSLENLMSSPRLETINRSQVVEALVARGKDVIGNQNGRDIGLQVNGALFELRNQRLLEYAAGVFNGTGINTSDLNISKDYALRIVVHPLQGFDIGGSYYNGYAKLGKPPTGRRRDRAGFELSYSLEPLTIKGEFIYGQDSLKEKRGWYAQTGVYIIPKTLQLVLKYDSFDPDIDKKNDEADVVTAGVNLFISKWTFLQANYELNFARPDDIHDHAILAQFTIQF